VRCDRFGWFYPQFFFCFFGVPCFSPQTFFCIFFFFCLLPQRTPPTPLLFFFFSHPPPIGFHSFPDFPTCYPSFFESYRGFELAFFIFFSDSLFPPRSSGRRMNRSDRVPFPPLFSQTISRNSFPGQKKKCFFFWGLGFFLPLFQAIPFPFLDQLTRTLVAVDLPTHAHLHKLLSDEGPCLVSPFP